MLRRAVAAPLRRAQTSGAPRRQLALLSATSDSEVRAAMASSKDRLVVVDYTASWCPPCKRIAPTVEKLSKLHPEVTFLKVDIDECPKAATDANIVSVPTFHFLRNSKVVAELSGAQPDVLTDMVNSHKTAAS